MPQGYAPLDVVGGSYKWRQNHPKGDSMSGKDKTKSEKLTRGEIKERFAQQTSLIDALNLVRDGGVIHGYYQHYTSLRRALDKIAGAWWLTRSDSDKLNDHQEIIKFGKKEVARRMYQTSFCHGANEDVAMWGLYQHCNPLAIRITIPRKTMERWIGDIQVKPGMDRKERQSHLDCVGLQSGVKVVAFGDLVYASVADPDVPHDRHDIHRSGQVHWDDAGCNVVEDLQEGIKCDWATSLVKDSEWRHERESRLTVQFSEALPKCPAAIKIAIPKYVIEDMRFTYSPWLKREYETKVERVLASALSKVGIDPKSGGFQRFRRSTLCGALNLGEVRFDGYELVDWLFQSLS